MTLDYQRHFYKGNKKINDDNNNNNTGKKCGCWCLLACLFIYSSLYLLFGSGSINYYCFSRSKQIPLEADISQFFCFFCSGFFFLFEETPYKKKLTKYSKSFVTAATLFKRNSWINEALSVMWLKMSNIWELSFFVVAKDVKLLVAPGLIEIAALWTLLLFTAPFCRTSRGFSLLIASLSNLLLINSHLGFLFFSFFQTFLFRLAIETVDIAESILTFNLPSRGTPRS